jgi:CRISPR-associated endonuclease Cas1
MRSRSSARFNTGMQQSFDLSVTKTRAERALLFIEDPGLWLSVRAGELSLRQRDGRYIELSPKVKTIVAAGHGFAVTSAAIRHCSLRHIELLISDDAAAFVSLFAPTSTVNSSRAALKVRERQFRAAFDPAKTAATARAIVAAKVKMEGHAKVLERSFLTRLQQAKTTDDVRHAEAQAAQAFWRQFIGFEMRFAGPAPPAGWHRFTSRYIARPQGRLGELGAQFTARGAVHPCQAVLNFATAIVTARLTRVVIAHGLDPCFGFLHDGRKPGRLSLVWDCVEPLRPGIVRAVFEYVETHTFEKKDFLIFVHKTTGEKTVRLAPKLAKEITALAIRTVSVRECVKAVDWMIKRL